MKTEIRKWAVSVLLKWAMDIVPKECKESIIYMAKAAIKL